MCDRHRQLTSMVTITADIVAMAQGAGYAQLLTVPGVVTMSMQSRTPRFHGMSQHRLMYIDDSTAACSPEYVELMRPRALGLVPVKSNVSLALRLVSVHTTW